MEAIVLAGGRGTRLKRVVAHLPKPKAPKHKANTPFLEFLIDNLIEQGVTHVVLSTGYMHPIIARYFGQTYRGIEITYSHEESPLLTGGALKKALTECREREVFVLNGDTFFAVELRDMQQFHRAQGADFTIAIKKMYHFDRYGTVVFKDQRVVAFREKQACAEGWINGGVYCVKRQVMEEMGEERFSLERDFLDRFVRKLKICVWQDDQYFIDIGMPEDYAAARRYFAHTRK